MYTAIKEAIIVEGRDDRAAVLKVVDAHIIETSGFGINSKIEEEIKAAYERVGIIIFTDPDKTGEDIRQWLTDKFPKAKQAYLARCDAERAGDIGVENAGSQAILDALLAAKAITSKREEKFSPKDMIKLGLSGQEGSVARREEIGRELGIGSGNAKRFLRKLNELDIEPEELEAAWRICTLRRV